MTECSVCGGAQFARTYCCESAASEDIETLRQQNSILTERVRRLEDEVQILDSLLTEWRRAAEEQGVLL